MHRNKKLIIVCHCILNQNSVVKPLARAKGAFPIASMLLKDGIGFIQLPCPEFKFLGIDRPSMTKSDYDCPEYRTLCRNLFLPFVDDIKAYISNGYEIVGILGIKHSPTCSVRERQGIFIEEINSLLKSNDITLKSYDIPESYNEDSESLELYHEIKSAFNL